MITADTERSKRHKHPDTECLSEFYTLPSSPWLTYEDLWFNWWMNCPAPVCTTTHSRKNNHKHSQHNTPVLPSPHATLKYHAVHGPCPNLFTVSIPLVCMSLDYIADILIYSLGVHRSSGGTAVGRGAAAAAVIATSVATSNTGWVGFGYDNNPSQPVWKPVTYHVLWRAGRTNEFPEGPPIGNSCLHSHPISFKSQAGPVAILLCKSIRSTEITKSCATAKLHAAIRGGGLRW